MLFMNAIVPYLNFNGNAAEALAFYTKALNGKVLYHQKFGDAPMDTPADQKDRIMHATFQAGNLTLMVSDTMPGQPAIQGTNMYLSMHFDTVQEIEKTFAALTEGASNLMPLQDTFWGARFGMLTDKFGINWMFNHDYQKKDK